MQTKFKAIGLIGNQNNHQVAESFNIIVALLTKYETKILIDEACKTLIDSPTSIKNATETTIKFLPKEELVKNIDLLIVVGGDGSLLNAARNTVALNIPLIGVNKGHLGFLTDIAATQIEEHLIQILAGDSLSEQRFLLTANVVRDKQIISTNIALNDVVLHSGDIARMLQFSVNVNNQYVYTQRADGIIIATPTGSTAYVLSAGGPILHPKLNAITLVPINPHTLSNRPIVIDGNDEIILQVENTKALKPRLSFDGQIHFTLQQDDLIYIKKYATPLILIHPKKYDYFAMLRAKLGLTKN